MSSTGYESVQKYADTHRKLHSNDVGLNAPRECTDVCGLGIFAIVWAGMIAVAAIAVHNGDLTRLTSGTDYLGNVCGHGTPTGVSAEVAATWKDRTSLFFPVIFNPLNGFNIEKALDFPVCLTDCNSNANLDQYALKDSAFPAGLHFDFHTTVRFGRCLPDFGSYDCHNNTKCEKERDSVGNSFSRRLGLHSTALRSFAEVKQNWWVILVCAVICVIICFFWLFILRRLVKPVVVVTIVLLFAVLVALGGVFYHRYTLAKENAGESSSENWYTAGFVCCWIAALLYLCVAIYLWKDIMVACDIIEEASKIPISMPTMVAVPPVVVLCMIPVAIFSIFMAAEIYTSAKLQHEVTSALTTNATATRAHFVGEEWRVWGQILNLFVFLWTVGFIHAIGFMTISFCAVSWYWSCPGDDKDPQFGVCNSLGATFRNHLGSLAIGSMIIAIIQTIRVCILAFERHAREYIDKSDALKCLVCCLNCCMACFDRFVQFVNKNAYVVQCLTGESFLPAARHALSLLMRNALSVGAVNIVGEFVMIIGKVLITGVTVLIGYAILSDAVDKEGSTSGMVVLLIAVGIVAYLIACVFLNVFGVCIDTVLISYCYDLEQNNGADKPYYCPDDLKKHVIRSETRARETELRRNDGLNTRLQ